MKFFSRLESPSNGLQPRIIIGLELIQREYDLSRLCHDHNFSLRIIYFIVYSRVYLHYILIGGGGRLAPNVKIGSCSQKGLNFLHRACASKLEFSFYSFRTLDWCVPVLEELFPCSSIACRTIPATARVTPVRILLKPCSCNWWSNSLVLEADRWQIYCSCKWAVSGIREAVPVVELRYPEAGRVPVDGSMVMLLLLVAWLFLFPGLVDSGRAPYTREQGSFTIKVT
jgi:hypothetical protein